MAVGTACTNHGWDDNVNQLVLQDHHYTAVVSLCHIGNLNYSDTALSSITDIYTSGKDGGENRLLFKVVHSFDKYLLTICYVPGTVLGLEI